MIRNTTISTLALAAILAGSAAAQGQAPTKPAAPKAAVTAAAKDTTKKMMAAAKDTTKKAMAGTKAKHKAKSKGMKKPTTTDSTKKKP
jgi:hypothetical protein